MHTVIYVFFCRCVMLKQKLFSVANQHFGCCAFEEGKVRTLCYDSTKVSTLIVQDSKFP